jgi:hypothetical protein
MFFLTGLRLVHNASAGRDSHIPTNDNHRGFPDPGIERRRRSFVLD